MPNPCFSYPAVVPPEIPSRVVTQTLSREPQKIGYPCFSYPYQPEVPRTMSKLCFSYPVAGSARIPGRGTAQAVRRDLRRMPYTCFRY